MPKITHYKHTTEVLGNHAGIEDHAVTAEDFARFIASDKIDTGYMAYVHVPAPRGTGGYGYFEYQPRVEYTPGFALQSNGYFGGSLREEALLKSNYAVFTKALDEIGIDYSSESQGSRFLFVTEDRVALSRALALACKFEGRLGNYPLADEEHCSNLETELISEGIESYYRKDWLVAVSKYEEFDFLFSAGADMPDFSDLEDVAPDLREIVEREISEFAHGEVSYSGELYIQDLEDALEHLSGIGKDRALEDYARELLTEVRLLRRAEYEKHQPPISEDMRANYPGPYQYGTST